MAQRAGPDQFARAVAFAVVLIAFLIAPHAATASGQTGSNRTLIEDAICAVRSLLPWTEPCPTERSVAPQVTTQEIPSAAPAAPLVAPITPPTIVREQPIIQEVTNVTENPIRIVREVIQEIIREPAPPTTYLDLNTDDLVSRSLFTKQLDALYDAIGDKQSDLEGSLSIDLLTVTGTAEFDTATIASLTGTTGSFDTLAVGTTTSLDTLTVGGALYLAPTTPTTTTARLYNQGGSLYWNGAAIAGATVGNWDSNGTDVYRLTGNVGIGTSSPQDALHVLGQIRLEDDNDPELSGQLYIRAGNANYVEAAFQPSAGDKTSVFKLFPSGAGESSIFSLSTGAASWNIRAGAGSIAGFSVRRNSTDFLFIDDIGNIGIGTSAPSARLTVEQTATDNAFAVHDETNDASPFVIDADGNVGIGTGTPTNPLTIIRNQSFATRHHAYADSGSGIEIQGLRSRGSSSAPAALQDGDTILRLSALAARTGGSPCHSARIRFAVDGSDELSSKPGRIVFETSSSTTGCGSNAERMRLDSNGNFGIGTTSPTERLVVGGTIQSDDLLGGAVNLTTDASGNIIRDPSDIALKENIADIDDALDTLLQLRGVRYDWIDEARFGDQTEIGFIAQEVEPILPEIVRTGGDYWSLNTRNMLAVVIEAIKEFYDEVRELRATVAGFGDQVTTDEICLGSTCIGEGELQALLVEQAIEPNEPRAEQNDHVMEPGGEPDDPTGHATTSDDTAPDQTSIETNETPAADEVTASSTATVAKNTLEEPTSEAGRADGGAPEEICPDCEASAVSDGDGQGPDAGRAEQNGPSGDPSE